MSKIKKSINIWSFDPNSSIEDCMRIAKDAGFEGIELAMAKNGPLSLHSSDEEILAVKKLADDIGIKICDPSCRDRGLGKRLLRMFIGELLGPMGYRRIVLDTNLNNRRAQHVYEQLGFRRLGVRKDAWRDQLGVLQSAVDYELRPEDFISCPGPARP